MLASKKLLVKLPSPTFKSKNSFEEVLLLRRSIRSYKNKPINLSELSQILWAAQGITEKNYDLRTAPSAGALYPLEIYAIVGNVENLDSGVYKYIAKDHLLEKTLDGDKRIDLQKSALDQESIGECALAILIAAVFSRTSWKYGPRAKQYVYMEVGHCAQNILLQATSLQLGAVPIGAFYDEVVQKTLNLPKNKEPVYIIPIGKV